MVIVESPTKAKTINKYLGSSYLVHSSMGHIRNLPSRKLGVDIENDFKPQYSIIAKRKEFITKLKKEIKKVDNVYLAPDMDREGEAIAWHLCETLNIPPEKVHRVTFNEITKDSILKAFEHPGTINMDKVNAQQARRILDRLVGYQISPLLWKNVAKGLSAGRVQSVAVKLISEREKEIRAFVPKEYWKIIAKLKTVDGDKGEEDEFVAELQRLKDGKEKLEVNNEKEATEIVNNLNKSQFSVAKVTKKQNKNNASPPFTTSLLQQRASTKLRFSAKKTMMIAQQLYEGIEIGSEGSTGLITYMRTDSFNISEAALQGCRNLIMESYGDKYLPDKPNFYQSQKRSQGAHEAIRPALVEKTPDEIKGSLTNDQYKLYKLIWERFVACQMTPAIYATTDVDILAGDYQFKTRGRILIFDGHTKISGNDPADTNLMIPDMKKGDDLDCKKITPSQHFTEPPPRYTEATLVKTMEKKGIGRPSTYAPIISTIQDRGYVNVEKRAFHATDLGILVTDKLEEHFKKILDIGFTSDMEDKLDKIEDSGENWVTVLQNFYGSFKTDLEKAANEMKSEKGAQAESGKECGLCGKPMLIRWGKAGKFLGCSGFPECKNTGAIDGEEQKPQNIKETDEKCEKCGSDMIIRNGRNGEFMACSAYPKCKNTKSVGGNDAENNVETDEKCEKCGNPMRIKFSRMGKFLGCSGYPDCKNAKPLPTGVKCPNEGCEGDIIQRRARGKKGFFYGCSNYPECDYITNKLEDLEDVEKDAEDDSDKDDGKPED